MRALSRLLLILALLPLAATTQAQPLSIDGFEALPRPVLATGGSNYHWFGDDGLCRDDSREDFGLLKRYHELDAQLGPVRAQARQQLAAMHLRGMRRLSLGIFFMHQPAAGGTLIDSSDPAAVSQAASNLALLLADAKAAGYEEVLFRFFAINNMSPADEAFPACCGRQFDAHVDEYWNLIQQMRPALVGAGLPYRIDLMVEGAPRDANPVWIPEGDRYKYPSNERWSRAVRTLWQRYRAAYGVQDTVGFSFIVDQDDNRLRSRVRHMRYVYEGHYPSVFAIDFYAGDLWDEYAKFLKMDAYMRNQNPGGGAWDSTGWIIAEAHYEDPLAAEGLARAIRESGRTVYYLTQWPLDRTAACDNNHINVPPPYDWTVWGGQGF